MTMDESNRGTSNPGRGLVIAQWYLDTFYDDIEGLPDPTGDGDNAFTAAIEAIETKTAATVAEHMETLRVTLAADGVRLVVVER